MIKQNIKDTMIKKYEAEIYQHQLNINIMMTNPIARPEHEDFVSAIDKELDLLSNAKDKLEALKEYF